MGHFLAVSAFKDQSVDSVATHVKDYLARYGVTCDAVGEGNPDESQDALLYPPSNNWTVVLWPAYFNIHDFELCGRLSSAMQTLVSTIHVYDDDYWAHGLFRNGSFVDIFASKPAYFAEDADEAQRLRKKWKGNPQVIAAALTIPVESVAPYLVHVDQSNAQQKAFPSDEFARENSGSSLTSGSGWELLTPTTWACLKGNSDWDEDLTGRSQLQMDMSCRL